MYNSKSTGKCQTIQNRKEKNINNKYIKMKSSPPAVVKHISCRWSLQPAVKERALLQPQRLSNRHFPSAVNRQHVDKQQRSRLSFRGKLREPPLVKQEAVVSAGLWRSHRCFMGNISSSRHRSTGTHLQSASEPKRRDDGYSTSTAGKINVCLCVFLWRLFSWRFTRRLLVSSGHQTFSGEPPEHVNKQFNDKR